MFITSEGHSQMSRIADENEYVGGDVFSDLNVYVYTVGIHIDCILNEHWILAESNKEIKRIAHWVFVSG